MGGPHKGKSLRLSSPCLFSFSKISHRFSLHQDRFPLLWPPSGHAWGRVKLRHPHTPLPHSDHTHSWDRDSSPPEHGSERGVLACRAPLPPGEPVWPLSGGQEPEGARAGSGAPRCGLRHGPDPLNPGTVCVLPTLLYRPGNQVLGRQREAFVGSGSGLPCAGFRSPVASLAQCLSQETRTRAQRDFIAGSDLPLLGLSVRLWSPLGLRFLLQMHKSRAGQKWDLLLTLGGIPTLFPEPGVCARIPILAGK